jgi:hypothetical protein
MNSFVTRQSNELKDQAVAIERQSELKPSMDQIVKAICADARKDALKYALRSDTGHDGE